MIWAAVIALAGAIVFELLPRRCPECGSSGAIHDDDCSHWWCK